VSNSSEDLVLASGSLQRLNLLRQLGIEPKVVPADIDETAHEDELPEQLVTRLASEKACSVAARSGGGVFLGADTVVEIDGKILGKAADDADAIAMLTLLAGQNHFVYTGVAVLHGENLVVENSKTLIKFREIDHTELVNYVATKEYVGKAGACSIQGYGAVFVESLEGSFDNVVGLPLFLVYQLFKKLDLDLLSWSKSYV